jgi:hypothetical protein
MSALTSTTERLNRSREGLRQALDSDALSTAERVCLSADSFPLDWLVNLKTAPGASLLLSIFHDWWARQPLRVTLTVAAEAAAAVLKPIAQRNPVGLVAGAALAGGLFVLIRPWRWISTKALLTGMLPQLIAEAIKHMPATVRADTPHTL